MANIGQGEYPQLPEIKIPLPLGDELPPPVLQGGVSINQNWDKNGNIFYTDENGNRINNNNFFSNIGNKLKSIGANAKDLINPNPYDRRDTYYTSPYNVLTEQYKNGDISANELVNLSNNRMQDDIYRAEKTQKENNMRAGLGTTLSAASFHPILNIPYVGTGIGGAMYDLGQGIVEGDTAGDLWNRTKRGFTIGETVGAIPYVGKGLSKTKAGQAVLNSAPVQAVGNVLNNAGEKFANSKLYDLLMTDIKAFNPNKQIAYHGSPYDFDKFSNEAIGTGEGVQAHGYGHYAALNKDVGEGYKRRLSEESFNEKIQNRLGSDLKNDRIKQLKDNEEKELFEYIANNITPSEFNVEHLKNYWFKDLETTEAKDFAKNLIEELENNNKNRGQLYKLSIPKDDVLLREGVSFAQQHKAVQDILKKNYFDKINGKVEPKHWKTPEELLKSRGAENNLYRFIKNQLNEDNEQVVNNVLHQQGIKGISYNGGIDGEARVIFNPEDIDIVRKYENQPDLWKQLKGLKPNEGAELQAIENALRNPRYPMSEDDFNAYENLGLNYYKNIFQPNSVDMGDYGTVKFNRKNRGKDDITNFKVYPDLFEQLMTAKQGKNINYKNEPDRNYDYFYNTHNNNLYEYLIENIDNVGKRYKMMRHIKKNK